MINLIVALFSFGMWLYYAWDVLPGLAQVRRLTGAEELSRPLPSLSIVIAARNEGKTIKTALDSVLSLDYPDLEVIVVNDRSEDETGEILNRLAPQHPNLKVVHVQTLPSGWLGKNHALNFGSEKVATKWMLFTDADVHFKRDALRRAISIAEENDLDHLTALPRMEEHSSVLGVALLSTMALFMLFMRPWKIPFNKNYYAGIGPFTLLKTSFYRKIGGHSKIKMRPDDDLSLGKLVKLEGGRSEYVFSDGEISFSWYESVKELINGLSKNTYASLEYSIAITIVSVLIHFFTFSWPLVGVMISHGYYHSHSK